MSAPPLAVRIGTASLAELAVIEAWADAGGWQPGEGAPLICMLGNLQRLRCTFLELSDATCAQATRVCHVADPLGFLVARAVSRDVTSAVEEGEDDDASSAFAAGELVGCVAAVRYSDAYGFVGYFMVQPAARRRGVGASLWRAARERLAGCRVVGLDAVAAQQRRNARDGFATTWHSTRYAGAPSPAALAAAAAEAAESHGCCDGAVRVLDARDVPFNALVACDARCSGCLAGGTPARAAMLSAWLSAPRRVTLAAIGTTQERSTATTVLGICVSRPERSGGGARISPLQAETSHVAALLLGAACARLAPGTRISLDVPTPNDDVAALARRVGLAPTTQLVRMHASGDGDAGGLQHALAALPMARLSCLSAEMG